MVDDAKNRVTEARGQPAERMFTSDAPFERSHAALAAVLDTFVAPHTG
jgi:hypothetical protein